MDEKNEKIFEEEEKKTPNGTNGENGEGVVDDDEEVKSKKTNGNGKERKSSLYSEKPEYLRRKILISISQIAEPVVEQKPKIGIKPLQFLTGCFPYHHHHHHHHRHHHHHHHHRPHHHCPFADPEAVAKSEMNEECGGKMKIDDLIIIPNNINHAEEGGSALQVIIILTTIIINRNPNDNNYHYHNNSLVEPCQDCESVLLPQQGQGSSSGLHKPKCKEGDDGDD